MIATRRHLPPVLLASLLTLTPLAAQATKPVANQLVARNMVMDLETGKCTRIPGIKRHVGRADHRNDAVFDVANLTVDLATKTSLYVDKGDIVLKTTAGEEKWRTAISDIGMLAQPTSRRLTKERVLFVSPKELLALDRKTGKVAWHHKKLPPQRLTIHNGLIVTTTQQDEHFVMCAYSLANGARACLTKLKGKPQHVAVGDHGIAIASKDHVEVFDRFGPNLLTLEHGVDDIVAHPQGWLIRRKAEMILLDRHGEKKWQSKMREPEFLDSHELLVTGSGDVVISTHHFMSDSGVFCQALDGKGGQVLWSRHIPGLGIPHSKYYHHAYARDRGDVIDVVSQGAGGAFVVTLEFGSGTQVSRHPVE